MLRPIVLDFETEGIGPRPEHYPPRPVGLAIQFPGGKPRYLAWGHPSENNCSEGQARRTAQAAWDSGGPLLFHHAAFDLAVAARWWKLPWPAAERIEDTKILAFLDDPERKNLGLKPLAEEVLGEAPQERDALRQWILDHVPGATPKTWGAFISHAPGDLVSPYAIGDVTRTWKLWRAFRRTRTEMAAAYLRERRLLRVVEEASERGMPVDRAGLDKVVGTSTRSLARTEGSLRRKLGAPGLDFGRRRDLADALEKAGLVTEWERTEKSRERKTDLDSLQRTCQDPKVVELLARRSATKQRLDVATAWELLSRSDGRVHATWNPTPAWHEGQHKAVGARTGRLSSTPNLQNVQKRDATLRGLVQAPKGKCLLVADYSQQEFRILAHFEDGKLAAAYRENPDLDVHAQVQALVRETTGGEWTRDELKTTGFGILYGRGVRAVAAALGIDEQNGFALRNHYHQALPGVRALDRALRTRARQKKPIWTWGGRRYHCEKPQTEEGPFGPEIVRTFEYKLVNTLIQGSAADHLKATMLALDDASFSQILFVHDEIVAEEPADADPQRMKEIMESIPGFNVPMRAVARKGNTWVG